MKTHQVPPVRPRERKPILYWIALQNGNQIDANNSIAILRAKWGYSATFHAVR